MTTVTVNLNRLNDAYHFEAVNQDHVKINIDASPDVGGQNKGFRPMQMVLAAHASHFGVCWNHFSRDLIESRPKNTEIYRAFAAKMHIPDHIEPIAIVAFGQAAFHPPVPPRMAVDSLLLAQPRVGG